MDIIGDSTLTTLQAAAAISADGNTAGVDCRNLIGQGALILTALNTAGTNPTLAVKLQGTQDADVVTSVTPGANTGNGTCTQVYGGPDALAENITLPFSTPPPPPSSALSPALWATPPSARCFPMPTSNSCSPPAARRGSTATPSSLSPRRAPMPTWPVAPSPA